MNETNIPNNNLSFTTYLKSLIMGKNYKTLNNDIITELSTIKDIIEKYTYNNENHVNGINKLNDSYAKSYDELSKRIKNCSDCKKEIIDLLIIILNFIPQQIYNDATIDESKKKSLYKRLYDVAYKITENYEKTNPEESICKYFNTLKNSIYINVSIMRTMDEKKKLEYIDEINKTAPDLECKNNNEGGNKKNKKQKTKNKKQKTKKNK
jgi:hypothetical protein